ncbi:MAG: hypothetical protein AAFY50_25385 [Cyanobacteria bacterium J06648_1]
MFKSKLPFGYLPPGDASLTAFAHGGNPQDRNASLPKTEGTSLRVSPLRETLRRPLVVHGGNPQDHTNSPQRSDFPRANFQESANLEQIGKLP